MPIALSGLMSNLKDHFTIAVPSFRFYVFTEAVLSFHAFLEEIKLKVRQPGGMLNAINLVSVANYNK